MNEYLIYLAVMTLVTDLVIVCACIFPGRISGKAGYGWRKILWLILAVRLLMPIQTISSIAPVSVLPVRVPIEANSVVSSQSGVNTEKEPDTAQGVAAGTSGTGGAEQEGTLYRTDGTAGTGEAGRKDTAVRDSRDTWNPLGSVSDIEEKSSGGICSVPGYRDHSNDLFHMRGNIRERQDTCQDQQGDKDSHAFWLFQADHSPPP